MLRSRNGSTEESEEAKIRETAIDYEDSAEGLSESLVLHDSTQHQSHGAE
jgi:hypothetical protein